MTYYTVSNGYVQPFWTDKFEISPTKGNRSFQRGVELGMDETAAWHLALWQMEMDRWFRDREELSD